MTLGQRIQAHRSRLGLSQEGLGDKLGVSRQAVSKWEADGAVPDTDKLIALSKLFGITLNQLLQVEEPAKGERPKRRSLKIAAGLLAAAVAIAGGVGIWRLTAQVAALTEQVAALEAASEELDPKAMVAGWEFNVLDWNEAGMAVRFQVTTARYDPEEELEVFFLVNSAHMTAERAAAEMKPHANGVYTATINFEEGVPMSEFTLSVGFIRDGVEYLQPLADFSQLGQTYARYEPLWP